MKRTFWIVLTLAFFLANEYLSKFILATFVGNLEFYDAFERTFQYASINSYLFSAGFRAIPFLSLAVFAAKSKVSSNKGGRTGIWCITFFVTSIILYGYWDMQHSLFTDEHTSSTSALGLIWIPIWALLFSIVGYIVVVAVSRASRLCFRNMYNKPL